LAAPPACNRLFLRQAAHLFHEAEHIIVLLFLFYKTFARFFIFNTYAT
jgi:hypothetical protein